MSPINLSVLDQLLLQLLMQFDNLEDLMHRVVALWQTLLHEPLMEADQVIDLLL